MSVPYRLILIQSGQCNLESENRYSGWSNSRLTETGISQAKHSGILLQQFNIKFDIVFTSTLNRAVQTTNVILDEIDKNYIPVYKSWRLNQRHYGVLEGLNFEEASGLYGEEELQRWISQEAPLPLSEEDPRNPRTGGQYDKVPFDIIPVTESPEDCLKRVQAIWQDSIAPALLNKQRVAVVSHSQALKVIIGILDKLPLERAQALNLQTRSPIIYELNSSLQPLNKYNLEYQSVQDLTIFKMAEARLRKRQQFSSSIFQSSTPERSYSAQSFRDPLNYRRSSNQESSYQQQLNGNSRELSRNYSSINFNSTLQRSSTPNYLLRPEINDIYTSRQPEPDTTNQKWPKLRAGQRRGDKLYPANINFLDNSIVSSGNNNQQLLYSDPEEQKYRHLQSSLDPIRYSNSYSRSPYRSQLSKPRDLNVSPKQRKVAEQTSSLHSQSFHDIQKYATPEEPYAIELQCEGLSKQINEQELRRKCGNLHVISLLTDIDNLTGYCKGTGRIRVRTSHMWKQELEQVKNSLAEEGVRTQEHDIVSGALGPCPNSLTPNRTRKVEERTSVAKENVKIVPKVKELESVGEIFGKQTVKRRGSPNRRVRNSAQWRSIKDFFNSRTTEYRPVLRNRRVQVQLYFDFIKSLQKGILSFEDV